MELVIAIIVAIGIIYLGTLWSLRKIDKDIKESKEIRAEEILNDINTDVLSIENILNKIDKEEVEEKFKTVIKEIGSKCKELKRAIVDYNILRELGNGQSDVISILEIDNIIQLKGKVFIAIFDEIENKDINQLMIMTNDIICLCEELKAIEK